MTITRDVTTIEKMGKAVILILLSCFFLALMNAFVKSASHYASPQIILFFQFLISFILILPIVLQNKTGGIRSSNYKLNFVRALTGTGAAYGLFFAITMIPLTMAVMLVYSAPIWMTAFAWLFFKEKITHIMWIGVLIGFIGIALILHPSVDSINEGTLLALAGGILMAIALLTVRVLNKTEPASRILFYYFGFATVVSLPSLFNEFSAVQSMAAMGWIYILGVGISQALSQILIVYSYHYATPAKLAPYIYSVILFTAVIDYIVWKQMLHAIDFIGMFCVIFGGVLALYKRSNNT